MAQVFSSIPNNNTSTPNGSTPWLGYGSSATPSLSSATVGQYKPPSLNSQSTSSALYPNTSPMTSALASRSGSTSAVAPSSSYTPSITPTTPSSSQSSAPAPFLGYGTSSGYNPFAPTSNNGSTTTSNNNLATTNNYVNPNQPTSQTQPTYSATQPGLYGSLVTGQANASQGAYNAGSNNYGQANNQLSSLSQGPTPQVTAAQQQLQDIAQNGTPQVTAANQALQSLQNEYGQDVYNIEGSPQPLGEAEGHEGMLNRLYATKLGAAQTGVQNALAGQQQQLTGLQNVAGNYVNTQGQQVSAAGTGVNAGITSQGQGITGLGTASGYAAPILNQYGQANYGIGGNNGSVQPGSQMSNSMQQYAQGLANGTVPYNSIPSSITGNPVLNAQLLQMAGDGSSGGGSGGGFNLNQSLGNSAAQQQSATLTGIQPATTAANQYQQVQQYQSALQQGTNLGVQLQSLIQSFGINPNDVNALNSGLQAIAKNTSSPQYKSLSNLVNDIANTYAQILTPTGGSQTDTTRSIASGMLDATASGKSIMSVMQGLEAQAKAKIAGVPTTNQQTNSFSSGSDPLGIR